MTDALNSGALRLAHEHAECVVCFEALWKEPTAVFINRGQRVCQHFFHKRCAEDCKRVSPTCPVCRQRFDGVLSIPSIRDDPQGWFRACDLNGDGKLDKGEVCEVLRAHLPIDYHELDANFPALWDLWDTDKNGFLDYKELFEPRTGLIPWIQHHFPRQEQNAPAPDIRVDKDAWFRYWDTDKGGTLSVDEVTRALIKSFGLSQDNTQVTNMRGVVESIWPIFDHDGSGEIDNGEFCTPDGLADSVIASL